MYNIDSKVSQSLRCGTYVAALDSSLRQLEYSFLAN